MNNTTKSKIEILSTGTYLPDNIIKSEEIFSNIDTKRKYGIAEDWMNTTMGIHERRAADVGTPPSWLAIQAAKQALDTVEGVNPDDIDLVIFCGIERDNPEPATAHTVQNALGLKARKVFDMANACFGFVDGVETASAYISAGLVKYALVVTGEVSYNISRSIAEQLKKGVSLKRAHEMIGGLSVGDAGGAVILGPSRNQLSGFDFFMSAVDSRRHKDCFYSFRPDGHVDGQMIMHQIVARGLKMHRDLKIDVETRAGLSGYDWMISHQTGQRNFDAIAKMGVIEKRRMTKTFDKLGNVTTATFAVNFQLLKDQGLSLGSRVGGWFAGSGLTVGQFCYTM